MEPELILKIVLEKPTVGVDYGLQEGKGSNFKTIQTKRADGNTLEFECKVRVKIAPRIAPVFLGPFIQGTTNERFIYIDIGTFAGQKDSVWSRRLKIPLNDITMDMIQQALSDTKLVMQTIVAGTGKDGGPNCGTVKPFSGWKLHI